MWRKVWGKSREPRLLMHPRPCISKFEDRLPLEAATIVGSLQWSIRNLPCQPVSFCIERWRRQDQIPDDLPNLKSLSFVLLEDHGLVLELHTTVVGPQLSSVEVSWCESLITCHVEMHLNIVLADTSRVIPIQLAKSTRASIVWYDSFGNLPKLLAKSNGI